MIPLLALQKPTPDVRTYTLCRYVLCVHHERDSCSRASQCQSLFLSGLPAIPAGARRDGVAENSMATRCSYYVVGLAESSSQSRAKQNPVRTRPRLTRHRIESK